MAKLNAGNVYDAGVQQTLDPQTLAMIKMLQAPNRTISTPNRQVTVRSDQIAPTVETDRSRRHQFDVDDRKRALQRVGPGLGRWAPAVGGIKAAVQMLQRPIDDAKQEDLYARIVAAEQAKKAEAAQAQADQQAREDAKAEAEYQRTKADEQAKWERDQAAALEKYGREREEADSRYQREQGSDAAAAMEDRQHEIYMANLERQGRVVEPTFEEKERIKANQSRISDLGSNEVARKQSIEKAQKFKKLIEDGKLSTGSWQALKNWVPGVLTDEAEYLEELDAFAETAARQQLKANGETRPTDADVKGQKEAMFGTGTDETTNKILLGEYIQNLSGQQAELDKLRGGVGPIDFNDLP